jgi:8-oxo-dGTP pyrophosphatase MutT (NUDIX family)
MEKKLFKVVITAIVMKGGKFLVMQRSPNEKKFPSRWTVPGGKLSTDDYVNGPKDTPDYWYNVLENALRREVKEEAGLDIRNIRYVTSLADAREGEDPSLVISCLADHAAGEVVFDESMSGFKWVSLEEARNVDLIEGIYEELAMAAHVLAGGALGEWKRE